MQESFGHRLHRRAFAAQDREGSDYPQLPQRQLTKEAFAQLARHTDARQPSDATAVYGRPLERLRVAEFHGWVLLQAPAAQARPDDFPRSRAALPHEQRLSAEVADRQPPLGKDR